MLLVPNPVMQDRTNIALDIGKRFVNGFGNLAEYRVLCTNELNSGWELVRPPTHDDKPDAEKTQINRDFPRTTYAGFGWIKWPKGYDYFSSRSAIACGDEVFDYELWPVHHRPFLYRYRCTEISFEEEPEHEQGDVPAISPPTSSDIALLEPANRSDSLLLRRDDRSLPVGREPSAGVSELVSARPLAATASLQDGMRTVAGLPHHFRHLLQGAAEELAESSEQFEDPAPVALTLSANAAEPVSQIEALSVPQAEAPAVKKIELPVLMEQSFDAGSVPLSEPAEIREGESQLAALDATLDPRDVADLRPASEADVHHVTAQFAALEKECKFERFQLAKKWTEDAVCLDTLARDAKVDRRLLDRPNVRVLVEELVARIGLEIWNTQEIDCLARLRTVWAQLKAKGEPLPSLPHQPEVSRRALSILIGRRQMNSRVTRPLARLIEEMRADLGLQPQSDARMDAIRTFADNLRATGGKIPADFLTPDKPDAKRCAEQCGSNRQAFNKPIYLDALDALGAELGYVVMYPSKVAESEAFVVSAEFKRWASKLQGVPSFKGKPNLRAISKLSGVPTQELGTKKYREFLHALIKKVGLAPARAPAFITLGQLRLPAEEFREKEVKGQSSAAVQKRKLRSFLNRLIESHPEGEDAPANEVLQSIVAAPESAGDRRHQANNLIRCLRSMEDGGGLPDDFGDALTLACERAGMPLSGACSAAGLTESAVRYWINNKANVNSTSKINSLEEVLGLQKGVLVKKAGFSGRDVVSRPLEDYPEFLRGNIRLRREVNACLSEDELALTGRAFKERCIQHADMVIQRDAPRKEAWKANAPKHALAKLPPVLSAQFGQIRDAATATDDQRFKNVRDNRMGASLKWTASTADSYEYRIKQIFGFLLTDHADRPAVQPEQITLALLVFPEVVFQYLDWLCANRGADKSNLKTRPSDQLVVHIARLLVNTVLVKYPQLMETLQPIPGLVHAADVARVRADWKLACREADEQYSEIRKGLYSEERENRSLESVMPILELDNPVSVLLLMLDGLRTERERLGQGQRGLDWALCVRDELYLNIQLRFVLRSGTLLALRPEFFYERGGEKQITIPRQLFKNSSSPVFNMGPNKINFTRPIRSDETSGADLWAVLQLYLGEARGILLGDTPDHGMLFVNKTGAPLAKIETTIRSLCQRYLVGNPALPASCRNIPTLYNHAFRHIIATTCIRNESDEKGWEKAAWFLMDTIEIVKMHYAFLREKDFNDDYAEAITKLMSGPRLGLEHAV